MTASGSPGTCRRDSGSRAPLSKRWRGRRTRNLLCLLPAWLHFAPDAPSRETLISLLGVRASLGVLLMSVSERTPLEVENSVVALMSTVAMAVILVFVMTRFGFLALCATMMVQYIALSFPLTPDLSRWFAGGRAGGRRTARALLDRSQPAPCRDVRRVPPVGFHSTP